MIYLDNAASTIVLPQVREKLYSILDVYGNPSSVHSQGRMAKELIWESKDIISNIINCSEDELFFTSGATMSNNLLLQGFAAHKYFMSSAIDHEDIQLITKKYNMQSIPVDKLGHVKIEYLERILKIWKDTPLLFSIQMANGEIGTIQDIKTISNIIHSYPNKYLHTDATQYIPYFKVDVQDLKIDALSMSGQKIGCIKGTGLLYVSDELQKHIEPIILGKQGLVGGTENVPGISCLGEAFKCLDYSKNSKIQELRDSLISGIDGELIGDKVNRLPNNVNVMFEGVRSSDLVMLLNENDICCSAGSACSSTDDEPSHTLLAIGLSPIQAESCIRFTLGEQNTKDEVLTTIQKTNEIVKVIRELSL